MGGHTGSCERKEEEGATSDGGEVPEKAERQNRECAAGGRGPATEPAQEAAIHFLGGSKLPPVSFNPWFGVVQFVLPGRAPLCKSSHEGASKLTSKRRSLELAAASKYRPGAPRDNAEEI